MHMAQAYLSVYERVLEQQQSAEQPAETQLGA